MSSDEDSDIRRLRSDLIKSIRSKKSSRVKSNISSSSSPITTSGKSSQLGVRSMGSAILDTDMDDLEALRRAALVTLKSKETSINQIGATSIETQSTNNPAAPPFPSCSTGVLFNPHQFYAPPPVLLGPNASFSQFPAPPPAYQSRFFSHNAVGFRTMLRPAHSNLIVIQTMPKPEDQLREPTSSFSSGKLILPQDRYLRRDGASSSEKRKRDDKWSRFEDSSSSSDSPISSDVESDEDSELEEGTTKSSDDGFSVGTPCEEETKARPPMPDSAESTRDTPFEGVVIDESISEEHSEDEAAKELETGPDHQKGSSPTQPVVSPQQRQPSLQPLDDEVLLEEPELEIEFLDEPVDDEIVQQLTVDSPSLSESVSTPEPSHQQIDEQTLESPRFKELKKQQLKSEYEALKQQLEELRHKKTTGAKHRSPATEATDSGTTSRHADRRNSSRDKAGESLPNYSRREAEWRHRHLSPEQKHVLSSVVALRGGPSRDNRSKRSGAISGVSSDYDGSEHKSKRHRGHSSDNDGASAFSRSSHRSVRNADSDDAASERKALGLPSAGEDLRKFLENKKDKAGSGVVRKLGDIAPKVELISGCAGSSRPASKVISLRKTPATSIDKNESGARINGTIASGGFPDQREAASKPSIKQRLSLSRGVFSASSKSTTDTSKVDDSHYEIGQGAVDEGNRSLASNSSHRLSGWWRHSGATAKEGTNSTGTGQKVKLRKRPY